MVVNAVEYDAAPWGADLCPRCAGRLFTGYYEPECLTCGYVAWEHDPRTTAMPQVNVLSSATRHVVRYAGESPFLVGRTTVVQAERVGTRLAHKVPCPFCGRLMTQSSLSGKRREQREERFKDGLGHRLSLLPRKDGTLIWK